MNRHRSPEHEYDLERLIFFTDGVFAIVITLLVIELRPPENWDLTFAGLVVAEWKALLGYAITFGATGAFWNAHRLMFGRIVRFDTLLVPLNLAFLALVVLLPFAAQLIFRNGVTGEPFLIYLGLIAAIAVAQALLWGFAALRRLIDPRFGGRVAAVIALSQLSTPLLTTLVGLLVGFSTRPLVWALPIPAIVVMSILRRRTLARVAPLSLETRP